MKNKKIIITGIIILVFGITFWRQNIFERTLGRSDGDGQRKFSVENFRGESENVLPKNTILEINDKKYESEITDSISIYDFMDKLRSEGQITFTEKNYTGMGKLIEEINGIKSDGKRFWIYYVNNVQGQVGVSDYKIKPGDVISWKYEAF